MNSLSEYYKSEQWMKLREKVMERDSYTCCSCGASKEEGVILQVDHLSYANLYDEYLEDLQTLCVSCHEKKTHDVDYDKLGFSLKITDSGYGNPLVDYYEEDVMSISTTPRSDSLVIIKKLWDAVRFHYRRAEAATKKEKSFCKIAGVSQGRVRKEMCSTYLRIKTKPSYANYYNKFISVIESKELGAIVNGNDLKTIFPKKSIVDVDFLDHFCCLGYLRRIHGVDEKKQLENRTIASYKVVSHSANHCSHFLKNPIGKRCPKCKTEQRIMNNYCIHGCTVRKRGTARDEPVKLTLIKGAYPSLCNNNKPDGWFETSTIKESEGGSQ